MTLKSLTQRLLPLLLLALGGGGFLLLVATRPSQPPLEVGERVWRVTSQTVEPGSLAPVLSLYGHVTTPRAATLRAALEADVIEVLAEEGRLAAQGQLLVSLDNREATLLLAQREADLDDIRAQIASEHRRHASDVQALRHEEALLTIAQRAVNRERDLQRRDLGSATAVDETQRTYEQQALAVTVRRLARDDFEARLAQLQARERRALALVQQAGLDLARSRVTAPFDARIASVHVAPGERIRIGDPVVAVYDLAALEVRARIPANYLPEVRAALGSGTSLTARAQVDGLPVELELSRLAGEAPATAAGVEALFRVTEAGGELPLGRFIALELQLAPRQGVVALPFEALYGRNRIYRLAEDRMRALQVERVGEWRDAVGREFVLIHSPSLRSQDRVVTTRLPNAVDGLLVTSVADD
ncbi:MAG: efflux RND transporter periplasmic adaptor subunit [Gammaproteobacteria bacterium]